MKKTTAMLSAFCLCFCLAAMLSLSSCGNQETFSGKWYLEDGSVMDFISDTEYTYKPVSAEKASTFKYWISYIDDEIKMVSEGVEISIFTCVEDGEDLIIINDEDGRSLTFSRKKP